MRESERPDDGVPLADEACLNDLGDVEGILVEDALDVGLALGVDENKNKEVESDDIVVENDGEEQK